MTDIASARVGNFVQYLDERHENLPNQEGLSESIRNPDAIDLETYMRFPCHEGEGGFDQ
jgi:hypothetical protein